ncbi:MAG: biopolymer transporter ExbD [Pseudomonadota bacterium]
MNVTPFVDVMLVLLVVFMITETKDPRPLLRFRDRRRLD